MHSNKIPRILLLPLLLILGILACTLPNSQSVQPPAVLPIEVTSTPISSAANAQAGDIPTITPAIVHAVSPGTSSTTGSLIYDVESSGTAPDKRAPYGDAYDINRLERPFDQSMNYIPDLDIVTYNLTKDDTWIYISVELVGTDPNNPIGIMYGVEIDDDADGFGDTLIWARPPYTSEWTASNVQVYQDSNHDTGGLSASKSDAPFDGDGYETLIYDGGTGEDPDLAWIRINAGPKATVQFAFKRSLTDGAYMLGVLAVSGADLQDVGLLDFVDRFTETEAGSPEKSEVYYPLKAVHSVDNACREAFGFEPSGYEPQLCPQPEPERQPGSKTTCENPSQYFDQSSCEAAGCLWCTYDIGGMSCEIPNCINP